MRKRKVLILVLWVMIGSYCVVGMARLFLWYYPLTTSVMSYIHEELYYIISMLLLGVLVTYIYEALNSNK